MNKEQKIDASLFDAVQYLRILHQCGADQYDAVTSLVQHAETAGDAAQAFSQAVSDTKLGYSMYDALMRMGETAPSKKLRNFAAGYAKAVRATGSADTFLAETAESLAEEQEIDRKKYLESLNVAGEIYLILFTAAPLFAVIAGMVLSMIADFPLSWLEFLLYAVFPAGTLAFLLLTDNPKDMRNVKKPQANLKEVFPVSSVTKTPYTPYLQRYDRKMRRQAILRHPIHFLTEKPAAVLLLSVPAGIAVSLLISAIPALQAAVFVLTAGIPYAVFISRNQRIRRQYSEALPGFWRTLGSAVSRGMTLADAVSFAAEDTASPLKKEISCMAGEIRLGELCRNTLVHFANRVQQIPVNRAVVLISESLRFSADVSPALFSLAEEGRRSLLTAEALRSGMSLYSAVIYLGYGVYLFVTGILLTVFLDTAASSGTLNYTAFSTILLTAALLHAICSGLAAGKLGEGTASAGVKHICIMTVVWVVFCIGMKLTELL